MVLVDSKGRFGKIRVPSRRAMRPLILQTSCVDDDLDPFAMPRQELVVRWWRPGEERDAEHGLLGGYQTQSNGAPLAHYAGHPGLDERTSDLSSIPHMFGESSAWCVTLIAPGPISGVLPLQSRARVLPAQLRGSARAALVGQFWPAPDSEGEIKVDELQLSFQGQETWADWRAWDVQQPQDDPTDVGFRARSEPPIRFEVFGAGPANDPTATIEVKRFAAWQTDYGEARLDSTCTFRISLRAAESIMNAVNAWIVPLHQLMVLACAGPSRYRDLSVGNKNWFSEATDQDDDLWSPDRYLSVAVRPAYSTPLEAEEGELSWSQYQLNLQDLAARPEAVNTHFFLASVHSYALDQYVTVRSGGAGSIVSRFISAIQSLEALFSGIKRLRRLDKHAGVAHGKIHGAKSLPDRLLALDSDSGGFVTEAFRSDRWARCTAKLRDGLAHGLDMPIDVRREQLPLRLGLEIALLLFELSWLREMGFSIKDAIGMVRRQPGAAVRDGLITSGAMIYRALE